MNREPFIYLFQVVDQYYFYDVNQNNILQINEEVYNYLSKKENVDIDPLPEIQNLKQRGYLSCKRIGKIEHPMTNVISDYLDNKLQMITLQVTQKCNLRCAYCIYGGMYHTRQHSDKVMSLETAKKAVDFLVNHSAESDQIGIGFYGGEPLLNFPLIRDTVLYLIHEYPGKKYYFTVTTNGTLFTEENMKFLDQYKFGLMISLDGDKNIHDQNRRFKDSKQGSFDLIMKNISHIRKNYPDLAKYMSFSTVLSLSSDYAGCNEFFSKIAPEEEHNFVVSSVSDRYKDDDSKDTPTSSQNQNNIVAERYELFKCILISIGRLEEKHCSNMVKRFYSQIKHSYNKLYITQNGVADIDHPAGACIPGVFRLFVNANGNFYPCEKVSEESKVAFLGDLENGFNIENIKAGLNVGKIGETLCKNCWAYRYCKLCMMVVDDIDQLSVDKKTKFCQVIKKEVDTMMREYVFINQFKDI